MTCKEIWGVKWQYKEVIIQIQNSRNSTKEIALKNNNNKKQFTKGKKEIGRIYKLEET